MNGTEQIEETKRLLKSLPTPNYTLFQYLTTFLYEVSTFSPTNRMEVSNLAIVFGPILLHSCDIDYDNVFQEAAVVNDAIEYMIKNHAVLFT